MDEMIRSLHSAWCAGLGFALASCLWYAAWWSAEDEMAGRARRGTQKWWIAAGAVAAVAIGVMVAVEPSEWVM